jgi:hypothetical protein
MRTHFLQGNEVSETGNSDSVTLRLLLASLESLFLPENKKPDLIDSPLGRTLA